MNKTQEILEWYTKSIEQGSICCKTDLYYLQNYLSEYTEALILYSSCRIDKDFPEMKEI